MSRWIDADVIKAKLMEYIGLTNGFDRAFNETPTIDAVEVVRCHECKHRPIKEDVNGENYGFNLIEPTEGDERCPCLVSDGWYSWMPNDNFYCGFRERKGE
jgi:hypothetical protein